MNQGTNNSTIEIIESLVGIRLSSDWIELYLMKLKSLSQEECNYDNDGNAILHQVLHSDLRDVVAYSSGNKENNRNNGSNFLREAIQKSLLPFDADVNNQSCDVTLPSSFTCLVQVEELLDISVNALTRLQHGPASSRSPTPVGNQHMRCLKLLLSDGCSYNDEKRMQLVGMEVSPIQDLSANSKPGIKVLLKGEIRIRLGVIMLHKGNAIVLGGCVLSLLKVQKKFLGMARRVAGVGVDPTVRALIWNPFTGSEEEQDEADHESRDVSLTPATIIPLSLNDSTSRPRSSPYVAQQRVNAVSKVADVSIASSYNRKNSEQNKTKRSSDLISMHEQQHSFLKANTKTEPPLPSSGKLQTGLCASQSIIDLCVSPPIIEDSPISINERKSPILSDSTNKNVAICDKESLGQERSPTLLRENTIIGKASSAIEKKTPSFIRSCSLTPDLIIPLSFQELVSLLQEHILKNPNVYEAYEGRVFVSPSKMLHDKNIHFSVGKKKRRAENIVCENEDKYEFVFICQWGGVKSEDETITCKITNMLLEPFFDCSASGLRTKMRQDGKRADKLATEGGKRVIEDFTSLASFRFRLLYTCKEYFHSKLMSPEQKIGESTASIPILHIIEKDE